MITQTIINTANWSIGIFFAIVVLFLATPNKK